MSVLPLPSASMSLRHLLCGTFISCQLIISGAHASGEFPADEMPLTYSISADSPNRIAVRGEKITSSVYDQQRLDVQLNEDTGSLFVLPLTQEPAGIFVMTQDNQTYSLTLVPDATLSSNIELTSRRPERKKREMVSFEAWQAADHDSTVRALMHALVKDRLPEGFSSRSYEPKKNSKAALEPVKRLHSGLYNARIDRWHNRSDNAVLIHEKMFVEPGIVAIALEHRNVNAHGSTLLYRLYRADAPSFSDESLP